MKRFITCQHCGGRIRKRHDLVTALMIFSVVPYHRKCFSQALMGCQTLVLVNQPINSLMGTVGAVVAALMAFMILLGVAPISGGLRFGATIAIFVMPVARIYSYLTYERELD